MIRTLMIFLFAALLLACDGKKYPEPDKLISEDNMVKIISEFMVINAAKGINKTILEEHIEDPTTYVFKKFQIDSLQFEQSNAYYSRNIESYKAIYEQVRQYLETKKTEYQDQIDTRNRELDSLKKLKISSRDSMPKLQKNDLIPKNKRFRTQPKSVDTLRQ